MSLFKKASQTTVVPNTEMMADLRKSLSRMLKMHHMVLEKTNIGASFFDADTIREMNEAPIEAVKSLRFSRPFAVFRDVKEGDLVEVDEGFDCLDKDSVHEVKNDGIRSLYIDCSQGKHYLSGQLDFETRTILIGIYKAEDDETTK